MFRDFWERHPRGHASFTAGCGLVFAFIALGGYWSDAGLSEGALQADAVVVDVESGRDPQYTVRFATSDGETVQTRTSFAEPGHRTGDRIRVEYEPGDQQNVAEVGSRQDAWMLYGGFALIGLFIVAHSLWRLHRLRG